MNKITIQLFNVFADNITIPDRRPLTAWALDNVDLPSPPYSIPGPLDLTINKCLIEPIEALHSNKVREVIFCGSPRLGKTLLSDAYVLYTLKEDSADVLLCFHQKETLKAFYDTRFLKLLKHNNILDYETMDRFDATQKLIRLPNSTVRFVSVQNPNSLTALGSRVVIGDECWRYPQGILQQIKSRTNDYRFSKKILFISQGCSEGQDFHLEWQQGQQAHWGFKCPHCNKEQKFLLNFKRKDRTYGGLTFDTNDITKPNGIRDIAATEQTARYECIECRAVFKDTEVDRRQLNNCGLYIPENPKASDSIRSYRCPAIASANMSYAEIVRNYLLARHELKRNRPEKFKTFWLQEMADFWSEGAGRESFDLKVGAAEEGEVKGEIIRFTTADVQQEGNLLYYVICEWNKTLRTIKLITYGKTDGFDGLNKLNKDNKVKDQNVMVDSGAFTRLVYRACASHHHFDAAGRFYCWTATKGEEPKDGSYFNPTTKKNTFFSRPKTMEAGITLPDGKKLSCPFVTFSNRTSKDILKALLDQTHPDYKLFMTEEALRDEDFKNQLNSEHLEFKDGKGTWVVNKDHIDNHYWDALVLQILAGGIIGQV